MTKSLLIVIGIGMSIFGCTDLPASNTATTAVVIPVDNLTDSVAVKRILAANNLDTQLVGTVSNIAYYSNNDRTLTIQLYDYGLDTLHIPDSLSFAAQKVVFYATSNHFKSWQREAEKIPRLVSLSFNKNPILNWTTGLGNSTLAVISLTNCGASSITLSLNKFPALTSLNIGGNLLTDLPADYTSSHVAIDVRANRICNPSSALDALLQLHDKQWRASQICPASP